MATSANGMSRLNFHVSQGSGLFLVAGDPERSPSDASSAFINDAPFLSMGAKGAIPMIPLADGHPDESVPRHGAHECLNSLNLKRTTVDVEMPPARPLLLDARVGYCSIPL